MTAEVKPEKTTGRMNECIIERDQFVSFDNCEMEHQLLYIAHGPKIISNLSPH